MRIIGAQELQEMQDNNEDFLLVNTLAQEHFQNTEIPGAVNIPQEEADFVQRVEQQAGGKEKAVVVYCASSRCNSSSQAADKLENAGFQNVLEFDAGAEGWKEHTAGTVVNR